MTNGGIPMHLCPGSFIGSDGENLAVSRLPTGLKNEKIFTELLTEMESCGIIRKGMV
jgi:hypothetical protein